MMKKSVLKEIDRTIKTDRKKDIQKDYWDEYPLREDSLKYMHWIAPRPGVYGHVHRPCFQ